VFIVGEWEGEPALGVACYAPTPRIYQKTGHEPESRSFNKIVKIAHTPGYQRRLQDDV
jgi:hypothetical protein